MLKEPPAIAIADFLRCIRERLDRASTTAKAAEALAAQDNANKAMQIVLGVEPLLHEVKAFLKAAKFFCDGADS